MFRTFQILPAPLSSVLTVLFFNDPVRLSIVYMTNSPLAPRDRILANFPPITLCSLAVQIFKARVPLPSSTKKKTPIRLRSPSFPSFIAVQAQKIAPASLRPPTSPADHSSPYAFSHLPFSLGLLPLP